MGFISGSASGAASGEPGWVAAVCRAVGKEATVLIIGASIQQTDTRTLLSGEDVRSHEV